MDIPKAWDPTRGWTDIGRMIQAQNRMLEQLPATLVRLTQLLETAVPALTEAAETIAAAARVTAQVEALVQELEDPIRRLAPAIERVALALDDPSVDEVPATLERIHRLVNPVADAVDRSTARLASMRVGIQRASARARSRRNGQPPVRR